MMQSTSMTLDLLRDDRNPPFHWCSYFKFQNNDQHFDSFGFSKIQNCYVTDPRFENVVGKMTFILNEIRQRICGLGYYRGAVLGHYVFCGESICLQIPGYFSPLKRINNGLHKPGEVLYFFLRLLMHLTRKTLCTILLDSRKYRRTCFSTEEELCICQSLKISHSSYYLIHQKLFSGRHYQVKDPLHVYSIYTLLGKFRQKTHPFPESLLDPLCTSIKFHRRFNEGNIITFSAFLFLVSSYEISLKDLKSICATVVVSAKKLVNKKRHSEGTFDYAFPDINLCAALVPGLYFLFLDLSESPDEHGYLFNVLVQKFFKKSRVKYFVEAICDFFNFSAFFSPVVQPSGCVEETFHELEEDIPIPESDEAIDLTFPPSPGENLREIERQLSFDGLDDYPQVHTPPPGVEIISPKSSPSFYGFRPEDTYHELLVTREEIDVIDGVKIVSFMSMSDLEEYSRTHGRTLTYPMKGKPYPPVSKLKGQRIMPTKTRDITKIKGWRNKVFASELYQESQSYNTVNSPPVPEPRKILGKCRNKVFLSKICQELPKKQTVGFPIDPETRKALEKLPNQVSIPEIDNEFQNKNTGKPLLISESRNMSEKEQDDVELKPDSCLIVNESKPELELSRSFDFENTQTCLVHVKEMVPLFSKKLDFDQNIKDSSTETVPATPVHKLNATVTSETISISDSELTLKNPMGGSSLDLSSILSEIDVGTFKDFIPDIWDLSFKEEYQHARGHINNIYSCLVRGSYFSRKVKKILSDKKKVTGTFFCKLVDVFLTQYSNLKFSYDAPKLKYFHSPESYEDNEKSYLSLDSSSSKLNVKFGSETCERIFPSIWPQDLHIPVYGTCENECIFIKGKPVCLDVEQPFSDTDQTSPNKTNAQCKTIKKKESPRKRHLSLLESCLFDEDEEVGQLAVFDEVAPRRVSRSLFAIPCYSEVENHSECIACVETSKFRLGMVVTVGYNRPLNQETISNIELLKKDPITIDELWANIAASAVILPFVRTIKRMIVPVVSKPLIDIAQYSLKNISRSNVGETVWEIVSDLADYVVRKETFDALDIPLDPDVPHLVASDDIMKNHPKKFRKSRVARELSKLCNVSLVEEDEIDLNKSLCCKEHCLKGCVCDSLSGELLDDTEPHCRNEECMFECSCGKYLRRKGMLSARKSNLAKEESTWHQKVICNSSEVVFQGDVVKTKREKKLPTRYRQGDIYLGKEMHSVDPSPKHLKNVKSTGKALDENLNGAVSSSKRRYPHKFRNPNEISAKSPLKDVVNNRSSEDTPEKEVPDNGDDSADEDNNVKRRRLDVIPEPRESDDAPNFEMDEIEEALGEMAGIENMDHILNYAFIWCTLHSDYFCSCSGHVFCTKLNILIKERIHSKHCTLQELSAPMANAARFSMVHLFNREDECARTVGSCFNYRTRNKSLVFKGKRELEIKYNIFSSTNSLVKLHFKDLDNCISYFDQCMSKVKALEKVIAASCHPRAEEVLDKIHSKVHQKFSIPLSSDGESPSGSGTDRTSFPTSLPESSRPREAVVDLDSGSEFSEESDGGGRNPSVGPAGPVDTYPRSSSCSPSLSLSPKSSPPASLSLPSASPTSFHSSPSPQVNEPAEIFKFGLLCMTRGFGYLPVNCYTPVKLSVRDPLYSSVFHTFRDLHAANLWLNRFFKERLMFEDIEVKLEWVIVRANLLKEFHIFDRRVLLKAVDRYGRLVNKKKLMGRNVGTDSAVNSSSEDISGDETGGEKRSPYSVDEEPVSKKLKSDEDEADTFLLFEEDGS